MMAGSGFQWVVAPKDQLIPNIERYGRRALAAVQAIATYWGQSIQDEARRNARWTDRTGNARGGLFFAVDGFGMGTVIGQVTPEARSEMKDTSVESGNDQVLIVTLAHTVYYGRFLELSNGGRYAIVMSTMEANLPRLERLVKEIFKG